MKLIIGLLIILNLTLTSNLYPQNNNNLKCFLRVKKSSYIVGEDIIIDFLIQNISDNSVRLKLSDYLPFNFSFLIKSNKNQVVNERNQFYLVKTDKKKNKTANTLVLRKKEFYGASFLIKNNYQLDKPGQYLIQGFFNPVPKNIRPGVQLKTQVIQIEVRDILQNKENFNKKLTNNNITEKIKNPYETINFMLNARKNTNWISYFKYIDLYQLIKQYPRFYKRYKSIKPSKREPIINEFKEYLKHYHSEIGYKKFKEYKVYKSVIENENKKAKIFTILTFTGNGITYIRKYIFYLYQRNDLWYLYTFKVQNQ